MGQCLPHKNKHIAYSSNKVPTYPVISALIPQVAHPLGLNIKQVFRPSLPITFLNRRNTKEESDNLHIIDEDDKIIDVIYKKNAYRYISVKGIMGLQYA